MPNNASCSMDAGVTTTTEGKAVAVPCEHPAKVVVTYAGVDRPMCRGHAHTFCRSRPTSRMREFNVADAALALGFESEADLHRLVATRDVSTPERMAAFKRWQEEDGSKAGLLALPGEETAE